MSAAYLVITNIDLYRYIQSFRDGFTCREHEALQVLTRAIKSYRKVRLWKKLNFWFNDDVRLAIPLCWIPAGQRQITVELAPASNLSFDFSDI
jgi:hypothetical protein